MGLSRMAWTWQTARFFVFVLILLISMVVWEMFSPDGGPRRGLLAIRTTRGDWLFISLLGSAFIHLGWLAWLSTPLWGASLVSIVFALLVFRFV